MKIFYLAATALLTVGAHSFAADDLNKSNGILVTATRLDSRITELPASVTVIDAEQIRRSPAKTLPELLSYEAGVTQRSLFGNGAGRSSVDIRGFGATATQNSLILVDGRRINDLDLGTIGYGAIPIANIERIEIIRGGGGVLYGDGAVGGAINIITRRATKQGTSGEYALSAGSYSHLGADLQLSHRADRLAVSFAAGLNREEGYRDNNDLAEKNAQLDLRRLMDAGEAYLQLAVNEQDLDLPGERVVNRGAGIDQMSDSDRNGTAKPDDYANQDIQSLTGGFTHFLSDSMELIVDAGYRHKLQRSFFDDYSGFGFSTYTKSRLNTGSITPRLNIEHDLLGLGSTTILGLDYYRYDYRSERGRRKNSAPIHTLGVDQTNWGLYAKNDTYLTPGTVLSLGGRWQRVRIEGRDTFDATAPGAAFGSKAPDYDRTDREEMLEIGLKHRFRTGLSLYGAFHRSVRFATVDELFELNPTTFLQIFSPLKPQTSRQWEAGVGLDRGPLSASLTYYRMKLRNEIHFLPASFTNDNLDPTRRSGLEATANLTLSKSVRVKGSYTVTKAKFRDGPLDGNWIPLVPKYTGILSLILNPLPDLEAQATWNHIGAKYFDNDQANDFSKKIPSYDTVDVKVSLKRGGWRLAARVNNLLDEQAYDYGIRSTFTPGLYNAYPLPERNFRFTVSRGF